MSGPDAPTLGSVASEVRALLAPLGNLDLDRFTIVGNYLRYDETTRSTLKDFRQQVLAAYRARGHEPRNFLVWGAPGSGKSYLVQQIAASLAEAVTYRELNLAQLDEAAFRDGLRSAAAIDGPVLCLIDEADAKPDATWPYETMLPFLEPPAPRPHAVCYCLAGSGGRSLADLKAAIRARPKGPDLLSRIPADHEYVVPSLGVGDKILVATVQLWLAARTEGHDLREIEKLALYYVATHPVFASARQLRSLAAHSAQRISPGEDRLRFDDLFGAGDPENKRFWESAAVVRDDLAGAFVHVAPGSLGGPTPSAAAGPARSAALADLDPGRIVVLPFTNISPDASDEYFADGMTEELIEKLAHVSGLRVIARTTTMHYKNSHETALEIGRGLKVGSVLECSIRRAGPRLRITAQLIDTQTEEHRWAARYDRQLDDIFAIQDDIATQIADALARHVPTIAGKLRPEFAPRPPDTRDLEAYARFLQAQKLWGEKASETSVRHALRLFEEASERDPTFARALVGSAECLLWLITEGAEPVGRTTRVARERIERALALDDRLAEAHSAMAGLLLGEDETAASEREARLAIELNPSAADAYRWLGQIEAGEGRIDSTARLLEEAYRLDPLDVNVIAFLGRAYSYAGRDAEAFAFWERTQPLVPFRTIAHRTEYYLGHGELEQAGEGILELERLRPGSAWTHVYRGIYEAKRGHREEALRSIERIRERQKAGDGTPFFMGFIRYALGDLDGFVATLEESFRLHQLPLLELLYSSLFTEARKDPRIIDLIRRQQALHPGSTGSP